MKLVKAIVIDNDDSNFGDNRHLSRIRIQALPEMDGIDPTLLPWVRPWNMEGMTGTSYSHKVPEIGSNIRCLFLDDFWKNGYYITGDFIDGHFSWETVVGSLSTIAGLSIQDYPNPRFALMPDGSIIFFNTATSELGILHFSGTYVIITATGGMNVFAKDRIVAQAPSLDITVIGPSTESAKNKTENFASLIENTTGLKQENVGGSKKVSVGSSYAETILDEKQETVVGNRIMTVGGNLTINLPNPTSSLEIDCGLGNIKMDGATGKVTINNNMEIDI